MMEIYLKISFKWKSKNYQINLLDNWYIKNAVLKINKNKWIKTIKKFKINKITYYLDI